jgi:2-oxoglutarate dehydrogenase complex dehydrogenase (E1) component-like enzyme
MKNKTTKQTPKEKIIEKIKAIITDYGSFNTAEINAESSPCITTIGRHTCQLAERFNKDNVEAITYVHENETATEYINYKDLKKDVLKEILELAKEYKEQEGEE